MRLSDKKPQITKWGNIYMDEKGALNIRDFHIDMPMPENLERVLMLEALAIYFADALEDERRKLKEDL